MNNYIRSILISLLLITFTQNFCMSEPFSKYILSLIKQATSEPRGHLLMGNCPCSDDLREIRKLLEEGRSDRNHAKEMMKSQIDLQKETSAKLVTQVKIAVGGLVSFLALAGILVIKEIFSSSKD